METSLRYSGELKTLRIHAKEKYPLDPNTFLQVQGELDTKLGTPTIFIATLRHFYPAISASLGLSLLYERVGLQGLQYDKHLKKNHAIQYTLRGKKAFPITSDGLLNFNIKGRCHVDKELKEVKSRAAAEFSWSIFNFLPDQDVRLKLGYEVSEKVPYIQIRENNWTFNADVTGRWNIRYDL